MSDLGKLILVSLGLLALVLGVAMVFYQRAETARLEAERAHLEAVETERRIAATVEELRRRPSHGGDVGVSRELIPVQEGVDTADRPLPSDPEAAGLAQDNQRLRQEAALLREQLAELQAEVARMAAEDR